MQLVLNGKKMNCPCDHLEDLKAAYGSGQEITIVNGFATTENLALKEGDEIYFIPKDRLPPKEALEGMMCSRHTPKVHDEVTIGAYCFTVLEMQRFHIVRLKAVPLPGAAAPGEDSGDEEDKTHES